MAFSNGSSFGARRLRGTPALAEINIIPLVDVVLVLLVIFMLTAHVMEFGMEVDVPKVNRSQNTAKELPVITITRDGETYLNDRMVNIAELGPAVRGRFGNVQSVYVRADRGVIWDVLAQVISACGDAGLKPELVTKPEDIAGKK
jgi:biopolymer transport protein ExbD